MKRFIRYLSGLLIIDVIFVLLVFVLTKTVSLDFAPGKTAFLALLFSVTAIIVFSIFLRGQSRGPESQTLHILVAISLKFLLDIGLAVIWFIAAKNKSFESVLIFFVIYLTLTLYSISSISKILKNRSLQNK